MKLHEAKSKKSNELLEILAKYITGGTVHQLIAPLKQVRINRQRCHDIVVFFLFCHCPISMF